MNAREFRVPVVMIFVAVLVLFARGFGEALGYDRAGVLVGEWYRMLTCHFVHWSGDHLGWDLAVFVVIGAMGEWISRGRFVAGLIAAAVGIGIAVYLFARELLFYRGLSGIDCTLFGMVIAHVVRVGYQEKRWGIVYCAAGVLVAFLGKSWFELVTGRTMFVQSGGAIVAVPLAHLVGMGVGILVGFFEMKKAQAKSAWALEGV